MQKKAVYRSKDYSEKTAFLKVLFQDDISDPKWMAPGQRGDAEMNLRKLGILTAGVFLSLVAAVFVWFQIPYSPLEEQVNDDVGELVTENCFVPAIHDFRREDFEDLPEPVQKYLDHCGYIGKPKMNYLKMEYRDADFLERKNGPMLQVDYTQYSFVKYPDRIAFLESSKYGVPLEAYDRYRNGRGSMRGVAGKCYPLFDTRGPEMDQAFLATVLAESLFIPSMLLRDYIQFEPIDDYSVKAQMHYRGDTVHGIFRFNKDYEMISFTTGDRALSERNGSYRQVPWTAECTDYKMSENGILQPTRFKSVWNRPEGDLIYFDGTIHRMSYGY